MYVDKQKLLDGLNTWKQTYIDYGYIQHEYAINGVIDRVNLGDYDASLIGNEVLAVQLTDEVGRHAKAVASNINLTARLAERDAEKQNLEFEINVLKNLIKSIDKEKDAEIQRLQEEIRRLTLPAALSHQTEQPDSLPLEMSHNDKYQLDCLIAKFGADYVYEYVCAVAAHPDTPPGPSISSMGLLEVKDCEACGGDGEIAFEDGDELKGGPCPYCQPAPKGEDSNGG